MEIVPAETRIANYADALQGDRLPANLVDRRAAMIAGYTAYVNIIVPKEIATKAICEDEEVANCRLPFYQAFMRSCYRAKINGGASSEVVVLNLWIARGLDETILNRIKTEVVDI